MTARAERNKEIFIVFPFVVAGEMINNLNKRDDIKYKEDVMRNFFGLLENEKVDLKPVKEDSLKLAAEIKSRDHQLGVTDLLINSQALCDPNSIHVLMHDKKIIDSQGIFNKNSEMTENEKREQKLSSK